MATIAILTPKVIGREGDDTPVIGQFFEKAMATFLVGQFVALTAGQIDKAADATTKLLGIAAKDKALVTDTKQLVNKVPPGTRIEINVYHSNPAFAITAKAMIGAEYGIKTVNGADGRPTHVLDMENVTQKCFNIIGLSPKDTEGDTYGRVICQIADGYYDLS